MESIKFLTYGRDINRTTHNNGVSIRELDSQTYYGVVEDITNSLIWGTILLFFSSESGLTLVLAEEECSNSKIE